VAESENIVVATAEKIFADLADAQSINHDKEGSWRAPLWHALTEAGLPLAWVAEDYGGSGASLAEGFGVIGAAGRFAIAVPLAETMLAGWLLAQAKITSPAGEMTVAPANPKDRISLGADGTLSGRTRGSVQDELQLIAEIGQVTRDASICGLGQTASSAIESAIDKLGAFTT